MLLVSRTQDLKFGSWARLCYVGKYFNHIGWSVDKGTNIKPSASIKCKNKTKQNKTSMLLETGNVARGS